MSPGADPAPRRGPLHRRAEEGRQPGSWPLPKPPTVMRRRLLPSPVERKTIIRKTPNQPPLLLLQHIHSQTSGSAGRAHPEREAELQTDYSRHYFISSDKRHTGWWRTSNMEDVAREGEEGEGDRGGTAGTKGQRKSRNRPGLEPERVPGGRSGQCKA